MRIATQAIKDRFLVAEKEHLERWDEENCLLMPTAREVIEEIRKGKATISIERLEIAIAEPDSEYRRVDFRDVIDTPKLKKLDAERIEFLKRKTAFEKTMKKAMRQYLDRALFDHESAYLMLKDFEKWRSS